MKKSPVIAYFFFFILFNVVSSIRGNEIIERIIGGYRDPISDVPYIAFLKIEKGDEKCVCGGSIVSENFIITAAHCVEGATMIDVTIGTAKIAKGRGKEYTTNSFIVHPHYNNKTLLFDVALVDISEGMDIDGERIKSVTVPSADEHITVANLKISGWGTTSKTSTEPSGSVRSVEIPYMNNEDCKKYIDEIPSSDICAGGKDGKGSCQGDDGGPAVKAGTDILVAIMSQNGCGEADHPELLTAILDDDVRSFIEQNAKV